MGAYEDRKKLHRDAVLKESPSKHNFLVRALFLREVDTDVLQRCCETVKKHGNNADFTLIKLIRFLYFPIDQLRPQQDRLMEMLSTFTFWPRKGDNTRSDPVDKTCFWSENHILMYLSSSHLYSQLCMERSATSLYEEHLLLVYLCAHCTFKGMYEVNSCVYLPYSMSSLLNLLEFSKVQIIRGKALFLLDKILASVLLVCNCDGIATLAASARQMPANRRRNYDHNMNQVARLLTGRSPDELKSSAATNFFLTSSFSPSQLPSYIQCGGGEEGWLQQSLFFQGLTRVRMNHDTADTRAVYAVAAREAREVPGHESVPLDGLDLVPFYWSAGLVAHPQFVVDSKSFLLSLGLHAAPGVSLLDYLPHSLVSSIMEKFTIYASGQNYSGISLNVYKSPDGKVVMSSFDRYNINLRSYQQNPWMVNFAGAPLWSQSGRGGRRAIPGFNSYCPAVSQVDSLMAFAYAAPASREGFVSHTLLGLYSNTVSVVWPTCYFEEEWRFEGHDKRASDPPSAAAAMAAEATERVGAVSAAGEWWVARRGRSFIGLWCSHVTSEQRADSDSATEEETCLHLRGHPPDTSECCFSATNLGENHHSTAEASGGVEAAPGTEAHPQNQAEAGWKTVQKCPLTTRFCAAANHAWVVCVGSEEYSSADSFIQHCFRDISVQQSLCDGVYQVVAADTSLSECADVGECKSPPFIHLEITK